MASTVKRKESKSRYAADYLLKNPRANAKKVNDAWQAAGKEGTISAALVNKLRASLGLAGNLRRKREKSGDSSTAIPAAPATTGGRKARPGTGSPALFSSSSNGSGTGRAGVNFPSAGTRAINLSAFEEIEADIDRLLFKLMGLGGLQAVEDELRRARRLLYGRISAKHR